MTTQEDGESRLLLDLHVGTGLTTIDGRVTFSDDQFVEQGVFVCAFGSRRRSLVPNTLNVSARCRSCYNEWRLNSRVVTCISLDLKWVVL